MPSSHPQLFFWPTTQQWIVLQLFAGTELIPLAAGKTRGEFLRAVVQPRLQADAEGLEPNWRIVRVIPADEQLSLET